MEPKDKLQQFRRKKYLDFLPQFKEEKTQQLTSLILSLIAFIIFGVFGISPTLSTISQLKKQISDSQEVKAKLNQKRENLLRLQIAYAGIESYLPLVAKALPQSPNVPLLTANLQSLGNSASVTVTHLQVAQVDLAPKKQKKSANQSFVFSMGVEGSYADCQKFLQSLTSFDRIVTIDSLSIAKGEDSIAKLEIQGKAYFSGN